MHADEAVGVRPHTGRSGQRFSPATTYAQSASISSAPKSPPSGGMAFLPRMSTFTNRVFSSGGNLRKSKALCGSTMRGPWHGAQFRAKIAATLCLAGALALHGASVAAQGTFEPEQT